MLDATAKLPLKDPDLFRQANCIAGEWVKADSGKTITVQQPGDRRAGRRGPRDGRGRNPPGHRGRRTRRLARLARHARQGPRRDPAQAQRTSCWPTPTTSPPS